jgi:molybdopterin-containing oxidoreductase family membrane subunit
MSSHYEATIRKPLVIGDKSYHDVTVDVAAPVEGKANKHWWIVFSIALTAFLWGVSCIIYTVSTGIGTWGLNKTVGWAWDITNFVWWVGIGHAGTLISAVLLLFRQRWRMAINRSAEAMTIFSVIQAGLFPIIHMGRPWLAYWVLPIPNQYGSLWVNFNSPLLWDVFAISTYLSVSLVFWWTGLLPDFAMLRDRAITPFNKRVYSILSFGWSGRAKDWQRFEEVSLVLAGLATPLVLSVHTIVSMDFATSVIPGWHTTIFPPYFVAGAVFSGFAMVNTLLIIMRKVSNLEAYITIQHIELMNIVIMITGSIVGVAYITELFIAWYSGVEYEQYAFLNRATGPYWWAYWSMMTCNVFSPQFMWFKKLRTSIMFSFIISIVVNIGMWFERFVIIVTSLHRDYLPSSWTMFSPTFVDIGIFIGTIGFFFVLFLLYARTFPVIAQAEIKTILKGTGDNYIRERAANKDSHHE